MPDPIILSRRAFFLIVKTPPIIVCSSNYVSSQQSQSCCTLPMRVPGGLCTSISWTQQLKGLSSLMSSWPWANMCVMFDNVG